MSDFASITHDPLFWLLGVPVVLLWLVGYFGSDLLDAARAWRDTEDDDGDDEAPSHAHQSPPAPDNYPWGL